MTRVDEEALVRENLDLVRLVISGMRRGILREEAEGAAREALAKAARSFDGIGEFRWWARLRMRGAVVDTMRMWGFVPRCARRQLSEDDPLRLCMLNADDVSVDAAVDVHADMERADLANAARLAMGNLPAKEAAIVAGVYLLGLTLEEAGALVGVDRTWACRLKHEGIARLRKELRHAA